MRIRCGALADRACPWLSWRCYRLEATGREEKGEGQTKDTDVFHRAEPYQPAEGSASRHVVLTNGEEQMSGQGMWTLSVDVRGMVTLPLALCQRLGPVPGEALIIQVADEGRAQHSSRALGRGRGAFAARLMPWSGSLGAVPGPERLGDVRTRVVRSTF